MTATLKPKLAVDRAAYAKTHGTNRRRVIVLHSTESHDRPGTTDVLGILTYLEGKGYGVHYCVDGEGNVGRGAYHDDLVYHCKGANAFGIGIEMIGEAAWPTKRWFVDKESRKARKQIKTVARLIASIAHEENIPLVLSKVHGVATHSMFPAGGHHDPGPGFPLQFVLKLANRYQVIYRVKKRVGA